MIGNRDYAFSALQNPVNDAHDMRGKLKKPGFEVIYRENAIQPFGDKLNGRQLGLLLDTMKKVAYPVNIVIVDACRDNPFRGFKYLDNRRLANVSGPAGSMSAFATAPGSAAVDAVGGRNSTYTRSVGSAKNIMLPEM